MREYSKVQQSPQRLLHRGKVPQGRSFADTFSGMSAKPTVRENGNMGFLKKLKHLINLLL